MVAFIIKYWVEFLLGIVATGLSFACKRIWSMYQAEKAYKAKEETEKIKQINEEIYNRSQSDDNKLQAEINLLSEKVDTLRMGILSMYGKTFKQECRTLLEEDHRITLKELESVTIDYDVYHSLGGNGDGAQLFSLVELKARNDISSNIC